MLRDEGERLGAGGGLYRCSPLHQQDEVRGQVFGQPQQAAGERPGRRPPQDSGEREGAGVLSAAHLPGKRPPDVVTLTEFSWGLVECQSRVAVPAASGQDKVSDRLHAEHGAEEKAAGGESGRSHRRARQTARSRSVLETSTDS